MDYTSMELDELKELAKSRGLKVGNIGKDKLIDKLKENDTFSTVTAEDEDLSENVNAGNNDNITKVEDKSIPVKSITFGGLTYKSRSTNAVFRWNQIGAIQYMTVAELNEMNNYKSAFLNKPLVILMDERAVKKFRLTPVYENVAKLNNLKEVFSSDMQTIERVIDDALRVNMRDILINKVRQMYKTGKLVDINVIRLLEKKLSFDLSDQN